MTIDNDQGKAGAQESDVQPQSLLSKPQGQADGTVTDDTTTARVVTFGDEKIEVPEQYWDKDAGSPNVGALVKSAVDMRKKLSETRPEPPESYEIKVAEDLADVVKANPDDPLAQGAMEIAKKYGMSQDAFNDLANLYFSQTVPSQQKEIERLGAAFGDNADKTMGELSDWIYGMAGDDEALSAAINRVTETADGVILLNHLRGKLAAPEPRIPSGIDSAAKTGLTEEDLRTLQASDAYINGDPAARRKVAEGWARLYPD